MAKITDLSDKLLVKILSFLPTKVAIRTSVLSKKWEFLWMWLTKLEFDNDKDITEYDDDDDTRSSYQSYREFIAKNLPLHKAPIIESLRLSFCGGSVQPKDIKSWVEIAVSRCIRDLSILSTISPPLFEEEPAVLLPSSLFACKSLVSLALEGNILVDVPQIVCLPSLKTLHLGREIYLSKESLRRLLSGCSVLEDLSIDHDNPGAVVVTVPSLIHLSLTLADGCSSDKCVIVTPALKYFKVKDYRETPSYMIEHIPELEEVEIDVKRNPEKILVSITSVKRLTLHVLFNNSGGEPIYHGGVVFNRLEHLKLCICNDDWSKLLVRLLKDSPNLKILNLEVDSFPFFEMYNSVSWSNEQSSVPKCLLKSLETFEFEGYEGRPEERDFLSYFFKHARNVKSPSILHRYKRRKLKN